MIFWKYLSRAPEDLTVGKHEHYLQVFTSAADRWLQTTNLGRSDKY